MWCGVRRMGSGDEVAVPSRGFRRQATGTADDSAALTLRVVAQLQALYLPILRR